VHFIWLVKSDISEPVRFGLVVVTLLALRVPAIRGRAGRLRDRLRALHRNRQVDSGTRTTEALFDHAR
jgi:DMSO/TMAO reductase YedYZ heme-binding membrane subunit